MITVHAYAAAAAGAPLESFTYQLAELGQEEIDIAVEYCGLCHSDLSMLDNDWGLTSYPFVPGHEVVGRIVSAGPQVKGVKVGDAVGLGWFSKSCLHCDICLSGRHNLCASAEQTIVGRHGGFADRVRCHWAWAVKLPEALPMAKAGPLFCGGITVFNPLMQHQVPPTARVGVIGLGGLGHMALQFLRRWGCEISVFTSSPSKAEEARQMGAHQVIASNDAAALAAVSCRFDLILNTTNVKLDWNAYLGLLAPGGVLHHVGAVLEPLSIPAFSLISGQKSVTGSPLGSPALVRTMLDFCARHGILPLTEEFPMDQVNQAMERLKSGQARYRIVLKV